MNWLKQIQNRLRALFGKSKLDTEMDEELRAHVELRVQQNIETGMAPEAARHAALRQFGWAESIKETCREQRGISWLENLARDVRHGTRVLAKNPGFSGVAILSLGLGIAANTTIFSFVNMLLFSPAPVEAPGQLWQVWLDRSKGSALERFHGLSYPGYAHLRDHTQSFETLAAFDPETPFVSWNRDGAGQTLQCQFVSGSFFQACRVPAARGRMFDAQEDLHPGANPVVVASHAFWKNTLGGDPGIVGRVLTINGVGLTVVGVAPDGFKGLFAGLAPDLWAPFMMAPAVLHDAEWHTRAGSFSLFGVGRPKPGVTMAQAQAELTVLAVQMDETDPARKRGWSAAVFPSTMVPAPFRGYVGAFTAVLMGAVFMVLLIACANAANLLLARAVARRREMAVRAAIGASRRRLMRQLLTESVLLALAGGVAGMVLTYWLVPVLLRLTPATLPIRPEVALDGRVFGFTLLVSLATGILFGLAPAWQGTKTNLALALKLESIAAGGHKSRLANALIVSQVAVCLVLLIAGGLCLRSLFNAHNVKLGFQIRERVTAEVNLKDYGYSAEQVRQFNARFLERTATLPGVESAAFADFLPLDSRYLGMSYQVEGHQAPDKENGFPLQTLNVGPGYFRTMGTALRGGREFADGDRAGAPWVAMINQTMADRFWPGGKAVGRHLNTGKENYEIVGVVEDGKYRTLGENPRPVVFRCRLQETGSRSTFVVHTRREATATLAALRDLAREIDPRLSLSRLGTLDQHLTLALFPARATGLLFTMFGGVALLLAVSGLFGVIAYSVSRRTREIGIRMALGAQRADVLRMVLRQGMKLAGLGALIGLAGAWGATRLLRNLLFGVSPTDMLVFCAVPALLLAVALLACLLPARRAARVQPMEALRHE